MGRPIKWKGVLCTVNDCPKNATARGWCGTHYTRWRKYGDPNFTRIRSKLLTLSETVSAELSKAVTVESGCLLVKPNSVYGYRYVGFGGKVRRLHRMVLENELGFELYPDQMACHRCDNRRCVNIEHLYLGDAQSNVDDMIGAGSNYSFEVLRGNSSPNSKLIESDVLTIRAFYGANFLTKTDLSDVFDVSELTISDVINRKTWKHI